MSLEDASKLKKFYTDLIDKATDPDLWITIAWNAVIILLILIGMRIARSIGYAIINRIIVRKEGSRLALEERRVNTLEKLLKNILRYTITFFGILMILAQLGIELMPIIAGAGVIGLAVAFGAQNLVRDVITGFFIIFEDQMAVGDYVRIKNYEGTVAEIGLRITKIKSFTGEIHIIPNGMITEVTNFSTNNSVAVVDLSIAYEEDISRVLTLLERRLDHLFEEKLIPELIGKPTVLGVQSLGPSEVSIRITAECKPTTHFKVRRELNAILKQMCTEEGIEIPYPRMVYMESKANPSKVGLHRDRKEEGI